MAPATRARVERLLDERNYRRRGLRSGAAGPRGRRFNGLDSPWAVEILRGIEEWCSAHGMGAAVSAVRHGSARPASWTSALASHDTDGVLLVTSELTAGQLRELREEDLPLVVVDPVNLARPDLPSVGATNWAGGLAATDHLLSLGHRRVGAIGGPPDYLCSRARIDGYRSALERAGVRYDPALVGTATSTMRAVSCVAVSSSTWMTGQRPSSPGAISRRSGCTRRRGSAGFVSRRTSASWASTTFPPPAGYRRR